MVQFSDTGSWQEYGLTAKVANADRLPIKFHRSTVIRPVRITVKYQVQAGEWVVQEIGISGPWILKGGKLSEKNSSSNRYYSLYLEEVPDWAKAFAKENLPAAETVIP